MALIPCPECGHQVSSTFRECPRCGYLPGALARRYFRWSRFVWWLLILVIVIVVAALFWPPFLAFVKGVIGG